MKASRNKGYTILELLITLLIMALLFVVVISSFNAYRQNRSLTTDTDNVVQQLAEARNLTIVSKNAATYGIHVTSTSTTLFTGSYSYGNPNNKVYALSSGITLDANLPGGTSDIIFNRVTGETNLSGAATLTFSLGTTASTTIMVYKTGTVDRTK